MRVGPDQCESGSRRRSIPRACSPRTVGSAIAIPTHAALASEAAIERESKYASAWLSSKYASAWLRELDARRREQRQRGLDIVSLCRPERASAMPARAQARLSADMTQYDSEDTNNRISGGMGWRPSAGRQPVGLGLTTPPEAARTAQRISIVKMKCDRHALA